MDNLEQLIEQAVSGDKAAQSRLYTISNQQVYYTCLGIVKNETDAEDIMQDVYMTAFQKLDTISDPNSFQPWINRIAVTRCMNFVKKRRNVSLDEEIEENNREIVDEELVLPDDYVSDKAKAQILQNIINEKLSDVQRETILLYYFHEMKVEDIAAEMDCPVGTVKYRLSAARQIIKQEVLDYEEKSGDRLHAFIPFPLGAFMLSQASGLTAPSLSLLGSGAASSTASSALSEAGNNAAKAAVKKGLGVKIAAGVTAAAVASGTVAYVATRNPTAAPVDNTSSAEVQQKTETYYDMVKSEYESTQDTTGRHSVVKDNILYFHVNDRIVTYDIESGDLGNIEIPDLTRYDEVQFFGDYIYVLNCNNVTAHFKINKYDFSGNSVSELDFTETEFDTVTAGDHQSMRILSDGSLFIVDSNEFRSYYYIDSNLTNYSYISPENANYLDFSPNDGGNNIFLVDDTLYVGETNNDGETKSLLYDTEKGEWEETDATYYGQVSGRYVLKEREGTDEDGKAVTLYDLYDFETGEPVWEDVGNMKDYGGGDKCYRIETNLFGATIFQGSLDTDFTEIDEQSKDYSALSLDYYLKTEKEQGSSYRYYLCDGENEPIYIPTSD